MDSGNNLDFYEIDPKYVKYLQQSEISKRGFSRVPNMEYAADRKGKFLCGVVLEINDHFYFAPVTSYKIQKPDNFLIFSASGNVVASLRFNYMFPVNKADVWQKRIDGIQDLKYKSLVSQELRFCIQNQENIRAKAARTYKRVIGGHDPGLVHNSCDFSLLENCCKAYAERNILQAEIPKLSMPDRLAAAEAEAARRNAERSKAQPPRGKAHERE